MPELEHGLINFYQACTPSLEPGEYSVQVEQIAKEARPDEPFCSELKFTVSGPRFSLNPLDVYSVYPPANQIGAFGNTLPHIVLTRRTLPWERTTQGLPNKANPCPWLALLVLSPSDFPAPAELPKIATNKVGDLLNPGSGIKGPNIKETDLEHHESKDDLCNTIDIPTALFKCIVPTELDLPYLAHVREVHTGNKETASLKTEGCFSVVLTNRFPETAEKEGVRNMAVLVSLEGFNAYLPGATGTIVEGTVRLAVLANWSFTCQGNNDFKKQVSKLKTGLLQEPEKPVVAKEVEQAWKLGYTALKHHVRNGEMTFSWYRGPLVPNFYPKLDVYGFLPCADAALRYNYETGLFDVSYAAAWQLGRLLALQSPLFSQSMYRSRNQDRQKTKLQIEKQVCDDRYELAGKDMDQHLLHEIGALKR